MARAVLCDLGGVLIRFDVGRIHRALAMRSSLPAALVASGYPDEIYEAFERDELTEATYLGHVRQTLGLVGSDEELATDFNDLYLGVDEDVLAVLRNLRKRGVLLLALTNTNRMHHRTWSLRFADALRVFDAIYCSHDLGARKPEPAAFSSVLDAHRLEPAEVVFVDDSPEHVQAARALGLDGVQFSDAEDLASQLLLRVWDMA